MPIRGKENAVAQSPSAHSHRVSGLAAAAATVAAVAAVAAVGSPHGRAASLALTVAVILGALVGIGGLLILATWCESLIGDYHPPVTAAVPQPSRSGPAAGPDVRVLPEPQQLVPAS